MRWHTVNYKDSDNSRSALNRGWWITLPRLMLLCRLLGHRPVVDGTEPLGPDGDGARWVCCDRCGIRPEPQGSLSPSGYHIGQSYTGPFGERLTLATPGERSTRHLLKGQRTHPPGPWPTAPEGTIGVQLVLVPLSWRSSSFEVKVGNGGSEQPLALSLKLWPLFSVHLHTQGFGRGVLRRLNPRGYDSRVTGVDLHSGHLWWRVWARRDHTSSSDPRWQSGSIRTSLRNLLLGRHQVRDDPLGDPVTLRLRLPAGDEHELRLHLQVRTEGRRRWRTRCRHVAEWEFTRPGPLIDQRHTMDSGPVVPVRGRAVDAGRWVEEAAAAIALRIERHRTSNGYHPPEPAATGTET